MVLFLVILEPTVPEVDLGFIISAGSTDASSTLQQIKDIIKSFINKYSIYRLRYGIISGGSLPRIELALPDSVKSGVLQKVEGLPRPKGTPDLAKALLLGVELLSPARPSAQKVLVIITDVKSGSSPRELRLAAQAVDNEGIRVFAVTVGKKVDRSELITGTGSGKNIINSSKTDEGGEVREKIMKKIREGKCGSLFNTSVVGATLDLEDAPSRLRSLIK